MSGKAPEEYSTNPHTIKSRKRKMNLAGLQKVEESARAADYKALCYASKVFKTKPEYLAASDAAREIMLNQAMLDTMEKRRSKGQDTMSKLSAFHANDPRARLAGARGPQPQAPIPHFLEENGFVPPRAARQNLPSGPAAPSTIEDQTAGHSRAAYDEVGGRSARYPDVVDVNGGGFAQSSSNLFMSCPSPTVRVEVKASVTPTAFANMTPEPMESMEADPNDEIAALRNEVAGMHSMIDNMLSVHDDPRGHELSNTRVGLGADKNYVAKLDARLGHLERVVHAVQNVSMPAVEDRVAALESAIEELKAKVGDGCDAEVAKMREVFGNLRVTLERVGHFF